MNKKIISILLSLVMASSLLVCQSFAAPAAHTVLYEEDFENFTTKSFNTGYTSGSTTYYVTDADGTARLGMGKYLQSDIITMPGYDGEETEAFKVTGNANETASWSTTSGQARITLSGLSSLVSTYTTGSIVYELKMYVPADINSGGEPINQSLDNVAMAPVIKSGNSYYVGSSNTESAKMKKIGTLTKGQWHKLCYVLLLDENKTLVYHNDELVSYKEIDTTTKGYRFQVFYKPANEGSYIIFDDFKVWHTAGTPSIAGSTTSSSALNGAVKVSRLVSPVVNFSDELLDVEIPSSAIDTVSTANVEMTTRSGAPVTINSATLSADKKTLTIDPAGELSWGTTYNVTVKNLVNLYQEKVEDYTFSFTVMDEPPFASLEPTFTKRADLETPSSSEETIVSLENGYVNASYTVVNNSDNEAKEVFMFAVLREGGALKAIEFKQGNIQPRDNTTINAGFNIDNFGNQSIEIYVWDDLINRNALVPSYVITKDGIETTAQ